MKLLIILIAMVVSCAAKPGMEKMMEAAKSCEAEIGLSPEEAQKLKSGDTDQASDKMKCFANCMMEKLGNMKDGVFQDKAFVEKISALEKVDKAKLTEVVNQCKDLKGSDNCDTAFQIMSCLRKSGIFDKKA